MFTGCGTALVTPFRANGSLDEAALRKLVRRQIEHGIDFLVPCGTTGESPTLTRDEHLRVVEITVKEAAGKTPVLAGAGGYNTHEVIELARECAQVGANGILSVTPYYNKPTQEGLYQHYKTIAAAVPLPIIVYSVQSRTGVNVEPATLARLAEIENIAGVKEASGNIAQIADIATRVPQRFAILSGDDAITIPVISLGGRGIISVVSNQVPHVMAEIARFANEGDYTRARELQKRYIALMQVNFVESNPIPVKYGMYRMGLLELNYRLPMVEPSAASKEKIDRVLDSLGLLAEAARTASIPGEAA
jgi:4-hydroxy-tetrahydrodipicolinate synthase